jgi:tetratricopeptide (TPR) repeat protein
MIETSAPRSVPLDSLVAQIADEFTERQKRGEQPDIEEYAARHPEHAAVIRNVLASLQLIRLPAADVDQTGSDALSGCLGDFRLICEVGRGGMGIVYEAEQISLGRRVALKVLPFAATMDPRQLQRFKIEAQAAAQLHHTNIVPVYYVGCERGVHFYAMQYIEGHSLAQVIADLRLQIADVKKDSKQASPPSKAGSDTGPYTPEPAAQSDIANLKSEITPTRPIAAFSTIRSIKDNAFFRTVADLGIQAAEALDCAHQQGIVHRDVKPANLMVDAAGRLWITDFGLAQVQSDPRLTMTGDLVGTLRYMSPEQALAKRVVVDHRTDIYSLGATLYELLTLEPAFKGTDREELLRQIAFEEPRPPRRQHKSIPSELEIIVLKALEKNPVERYATAKELAEDLRRFAMDEPIRARRPTLAHRARKWARRHRSAATAATVCLLVTLAVTIGSIGWVLGDHLSRKRQAEAIAVEALEAAKPGLQQGNPWDRGLVSALRQAEAQLQSGLLSPEVQRRVEQLQKDVKMLTELERISLEKTMGVHDDHFYSPGSADEFRQAFLEYGLDVVRLEPEEAIDLLQRSAIRNHLVAGLDMWQRALSQGSGKHGRPDAEQVQALANQFYSPWVKQLYAAHDKQEIERLLLTAPIEELAPAMIRIVCEELTPRPILITSAPPPKIITSLTAVEFLRRAQALYPADFWTNHHLALVLYCHREPRLQEEAVGFYRAAVALHPDSPGARLNLGDALQDLGRLDEAIAAFQKAIDLKPDYGAAHHNLGGALHLKGMLDEAITEYRKAIDLKPQSALGHECLGRELHEKGLVEEAITEFRKAIELRPDSVEARTDLGTVLRNKGRLDEAINEYRKAIELLPEEAIFHANLGDALTAKGQLDEAFIEVRKAIDLKPDSAGAHLCLGNALRGKGQLDEAITQYRKAIGLKPDYAEAHCNLGMALRERGMLDEAISEFRKAIQIKPDYAEAHCNLGVAFVQKGMLDEGIAEFRKAIELKPLFADAHQNLGAVLVHIGLLDEGMTECRRALELEPGHAFAQQSLDRAQKWLKLDAKLPKFLKEKAQPADAAERIALADLCQQKFKELYFTAARFYAEAFAAQPQLADDLENEHRYNAACAAALAGCGQGKDADQTDDKERLRLRCQALEWLRADLAAYRQLLDKGPDKARPIANLMHLWQQDKDFAGVRGPEALAQLAEAERAEWSKLWQEVAALGKQAAEGKGDQQNSTPPRKEVPDK